MDCDEDIQRLKQALKEQGHEYNENRLYKWQKKMEDDNVASRWIKAGAEEAEMAKCRSTLDPTKELEEITKEIKERWAPQEAAI